MSDFIVRDEALSPRMLERIRTDWPAPDWPGWVHYDPAYEHKRASDLTTPLPPACGEALAQLAALPVKSWFPYHATTIADLGLHGAGLHEMPPGQGLGRHLDADTHARLGIARVLSAVLWVHAEWKPTWGGELLLGDAATNPTLIRPTPGRLVVFDCSSEPHEVVPITAPRGHTRKALALFWYAPRPGNGQRLRAAFDGHADR